MKDMIDRQAAIDALRTCYDTEAITHTNGNEYIDYDQALDLINTLPSAQPERKRGRWIYGEDNLGTGRDGWFCSECGHFELWDYSADMKSAELNLPNYCPNCGADMRGETDE